MSRTFDAFDVVIANGAGDCPKYEVTLHRFGQTVEGDAHNQLVIEGIKLIEDAIREKLASESDGR